MVHRIRRFDPFSTAKVAGVIYAIFGLIFAPIFILASMFAPDEAASASGLPSPSRSSTGSSASSVR